MKTDNHNDWTDAFRESFPEEARPAAGGWEAVAGRMRRAAARRRAAIAAAALALPVAGGIFFIPQRHGTTGPEIAVVDTPSVSIPNSPDTDVAQDAPALMADIPASGRVLRNVSSEPVSSRISDPVPENATAEHADRENDSPVNPDDREDSVPPESESTPSAVLGEAIDLPDLFAGTTDAPAHRRRLTIGLAGGTTAGGTPTTVTAGSMSSELSTKSSNNFWNNTTTTVLQHGYFHDLPLSFGVTASYSLTDRISLESGIEYTRLHSRLDDIHTFMHFAGIPVRMDYRLFSSGRFDFYAGVGGEVEKCLKATLGGMRVSEKKLQWSGSALLGAQVRLARNISLYLQPDLTYYFTKTSLVSYRTENRLSLSVHAGLRFNIE